MRPQAIQHVPPGKARFERKDIKVAYVLWTGASVLLLLAGLGLFLAWLEPLLFHHQAGSGVAQALAGPEPDAGFEPHPGATLPRDVSLVREDGAAVTTGALLRGKPVVLTFVYLTCPNLCSLVLKDLVAAVASLPERVGAGFDVWVVSIDPTEDITRVAGTRQQLLQAYGRPGTEAGWHVLRGRADQVERLANAVGIRYAFDPQSRQYRHPSALVTLTPAGQVSRYLLGLGIKPRDIRLALAEARDGQVAAPTAQALDRLLLLCYHYDATAGRYSLAAQNVVRFGSVGAASLFGILLWRLSRCSPRPGKDGAV
jgi:protein SCO1/2